MPSDSKKMAEKAMEKIAQGAGGRALGIAAGVGLGAGMLGAVYGGEKAISKAYSGATYKRDYENMIGFAPEIKNYDKEQVKARFDTLRRFNRKMSADPLVASSWIKQTIEYPVVTPATLKDVMEREQPLSASIARVFPRTDIGPIGE